MEIVTEFKLILKVIHETNKARYTQTIEFDSYRELANWLDTPPDNPGEWHA